ncbi:MAG TPA: Holliday junction resolvase RecU [Blastocatellia bacterium]|nr:Holliday junction resolvase RecU [Blastocatellia bacterium]
MNLKRRGAETGSGFQDAINRTNEAYERLGRACITRKAIPGKYLIERGESRRGLSLPALNIASHGTQLRLNSSALKVAVKEHKSQDWRRFVPESKAEPDYGGVIAPLGRAIYYDAKTTRREVLDFDNLHAHQITYLERVAKMGAVAGFLVEFSKYAEVYFLPIQVLTIWREEVTRKSLPYHFFVESLVPALTGKGLLIFDYLAAIEEQEQRYGTNYSQFIIQPEAARRARRKTA